MNFGDGFYAIFQAPVRWIFKARYNIVEEINELKDYKGAYLLIGPHMSLLDSLIAIAYSHKLVRFLAADGNWDVKWKKWVFKMFNVIPFARKRLDVKAIRQLKETVEQGKSIGLFPEGARSWDGKELPIIPSIAKLIKLLKVPVFNITFDGLHLSAPRWADGNERKGKVVINIKRIYSQNEINKATKQEVLSKIEQVITFNEFDWQRKNRVVFKGKNYAEHIERLLYLCPKCEAVNSLHSKGNSFSCDACGAVYSINLYAFIEGCDRFDNTIDWNAWQKPFIKQFIKTDYHFTNKDVKLECIENGSLSAVTIDMTLTPTTLILDDKDGHVVSIPVSEFRTCNALFCDKIEIWHGDVKYRLQFEPQKSHMSLKLFESMMRLHIENAEADYKAKKNNG